jgi:hypothetical protein
MLKYNGAQRTWTLSVQTEAYGAICVQTGTVIVLRPTATPAVSSTPPAE